MKGFGGSNGDMTVNARIRATCFQSFLKKEKKQTKSKNLWRGSGKIPLVKSTLYYNHVKWEKPVFGSAENCCYKDDLYFKLRFLETFTSVY